MSALPGEFKYSEARLADNLGISRNDSKFLRDRHLRSDRDWKKVGGVVAINLSGLKKMWRLVGDRPRELDLASCLLNGSKKNGADCGTGLTEESAAPDKPIPLGDVRMPIPRKMCVSRICENPRVLLALDEHGVICSVDVGRNETFVVGDKIDTAPHSSQPGFWRLLGPLPRDRRRIGGRPL